MLAIYKKKLTTSDGSNKFLISINYTVLSLNFEQFLIMMTTKKNLVNENLYASKIYFANLMISLDGTKCKTRRKIVDKFQWNLPSNRRYVNWIEINVN